MLAPISYPVKAYRPNAVDCRKVNAFKAAQLLTVEKKQPDFAWFKPERKLYYCYPEPAPVLMLGPGPQPVALIPATCPVKSITAPIVRAAQKKEVQVVLSYQSVEIQPTSSPVVPSTPTRAWASASPSGVTTIDTKKSAEILSQARVNNSPWLGKRDAILHARV